MNFGFWIVDFGLRARTAPNGGGSAFQSKIQNLKSKIPWLLMAFCIVSIRAEETEVPVALETTGGSRVVGMMDARRPLVLRPDGKPSQPLEYAKLKSILFGERPDPNQENEARLALGDLQSDQFLTRESARAKLRSLGRAALGPLHRAMSSPDAEVANQARALIGEMNVQNAADSSSDHVTLSDGTVVSGQLLGGDVTVRTRWGALNCPLRSAAKLEFLNVQDVHVELLVPAGQGAKLALSTTATAAGGAERWSPRTEEEEDLHGLRKLTISRMPDPKPGADRRATIEIKAGDKLDDAFCAWGIQLRPTNTASKIEASDTQVFGISRGLSACVKESDLDLQFLLSGDKRAGGVSVVGAVVKAEAAGTIGLAVYDRSGRLLAQVLNVAESNIAAGGAQQDEFLGVQSKVPIVRARFFRTGEGAAKPKDIVFDDLVFDRVVSIDRSSDRACVWLSDGERLAGVIAPPAVDDGFNFRPEFFDANTPPALISAAEIERYEPPVFISTKDAPPKFMGTPHAILLQNGECFRARLMKLDEKASVFMLPGGVELALPRSILRKIDLAPTRPEPGELPPPITVGDDEKASVDLKTKEPPKKTDGDANEKPKKDEHNPAPGKSHMENAEVVAYDPADGTVTIRDDDGDLPIGIPQIKSFVFNKDPNATKSAPKFRDWVLVLREGSRFEIHLSAISQEGVKAEMSGGTVILPSHVIDSVQRQKTK
jgi:hypothetical protein